MKNLTDVIESLEFSLHNILDARADSKYIQGVEGIVAYEELDTLATMIKLKLEKLKGWAKESE